MSVYFAESCGYIKIGYSADPTRRIASITRNGTRPDDVPFDAPADLIGWVPGDRWVEGRFHANHIASRVVGEWFTLDRRMIEDLIWADPRGVLVHRMPAFAVRICLERPDLTRDQLAAAGVRIEAPGMDEIFAQLDRWLVPAGGSS